MSDHFDKLKTLRVGSEEHKPHIVKVDPLVTYKEEPDYKRLSVLALRWLAVLPCFVLIHILVNAIAKGLSVDPESLSFWARWVASGIAPANAIAGAIRVAPTGRFITAIVLATLNILFSGFLLLMSAIYIFKPDPEITTWECIQGAVAAAISVIACVYACMQAKELE